MSSYLAEQIHREQAALVALPSVATWLRKAAQSWLQLYVHSQGRTYYLGATSAPVEARLLMKNPLVDSFRYVAYWSYDRMLGCCGYGHISGFTCTVPGLARWLWPRLEEAILKDGYSAIFGTTATTETREAMLHLLKVYGWEPIGKDFTNRRTGHEITTWRKLLNATNAGKRVG